MRRLVDTRAKYGNKKTTVDGMVFDSAVESRRYRELTLLARAGEISGLVLQPAYELLAPFVDNEGKRHRAITYVGDFFYYDKESHAHVDDVKGKATREFAIKEKLFRQRYPDIRFTIVKE